MSCSLGHALEEQMQGFAPDELLLQLKTGHLLSQEERTLFSVDGTRLEIKRVFTKNKVILAKTQPGLSVQEAVRRLRKMDQVALAEPNYYRQVCAVKPNDPLYNQQWALPKIQADEAWEQTTGTHRVVVGLADSGIDLGHEDLQGNLWQNPGEICGNGLDDDNDGYVDNCFGLDALNDIGEPVDEVGHGTIVSGVIGARGNNVTGISGVNWQTSLMALKFIGPDGTGRVSDLIQAIEFAMDNDVRIINMSFGSYNYSQFEQQAIQNAGNILFVAAAGNESANNDISPLYPASYDLPNIISVAASTPSDSLIYFSNYGPQTVSLAAPGVNILSTGLLDSYQEYSGTSMSTAFVSGVAALVLAADNSLSAVQLRDRILRTVDVVPAMQGKVLSQGRVNAAKAVSYSGDGPYIFSLSPQKAPVGAEISIMGTSFQNTPGSVMFSGMEAPIDSWSNHQIVCRVPEGAQSGKVQVRTLGGMLSNEVQFEVLSEPEMYRFSFAHASCLDEDLYFLILSNVQAESIQVHVRGVGANGDIIIKIITLQPYANKVLRMADFGVQDEEMMLNLESNSFFGAYLLTFSQDGQIIPMYAHPWGPESIYNDRLSE